MEKSDIKYNHNIIIVLGELCSGKNTFAQNLIFHQIVDISDIVRSITSTEQRVHDQSLDVEIINQLKPILDQGNVAVIGIRQISILNFVMSYNDVEVIYLDVDHSELKRRYINRANIKDAKLSFEQALDKDNKLGFLEIKKFVEKNNIKKIKN